MQKNVLQIWRSYIAPNLTVVVLVIIVIILLFNASSNSPVSTNVVPVTVAATTPTTTTASPVTKTTATVINTAPIASAPSSVKATKSQVDQNEYIPPKADRQLPYVLKGNVETNCRFAGYPICCQAVDQSLGYYPKKASATKQGNNRLAYGSSKCEILVEYIPSAYEEKHLKMAKHISRLSNETDRANELLEFVWKDIPESNKWIKKLQKRGKIANSSADEPDDAEYLSRFRFQQDCGTKHVWDEWIEPLTV